MQEPMRDATGKGNALLPLDVEGLSFEIDGKRLIDGIDLRLTRPGISMVMGPNGAGKSLLLRLLHGILPPSAGRITWNGVPVCEEIRKRQAFVFQRPVLLRRSVAANIDFVLGLRGRADPLRRQQIMEEIGLADHARQPARLLSGGEQQRLALGRALALEPELLFLDEPTASLDPGSVGMIERIVLQASEGGTKIIFVSHDIGQARRLADEIVFMHRGRICEQTLADRFFDEPASPQAGDYLAGRLVL